MSEVVTIRSADYAALAADADAWRDLGVALASQDAELWGLIQSPHVRHLLLIEMAEWAERQQMSTSTAEMSAALDWRTRASTPTYAELERRRNTYTTPALTPAQIRQHAAASWDALDTHQGAAA